MILVNCVLDLVNNKQTNQKNLKETNITYIRHFFRYILVSPQIPEVKSSDVAQGDTATLACIVSSFPPSNITWRRNGLVLSSNSNKYNFINSNYTLQVKNALFEDAGDYECEAVNELGGAVANASLTVGCK